MFDVPHALIKLDSICIITSHIEVNEPRVLIVADALKVLAELSSMTKAPTMRRNSQSRDMCMPRQIVHVLVGGR